MHRTPVAILIGIFGAALMIGPRSAPAQIVIPLQLHFDILADPFSLDHEYTDSMLAIQMAGTAVIPEVVKRLPTDDIEAKLRLIEILGRFGPEAAGAVSELGGLMRHENVFVRAAAIRAIGCIGPAATRLQPELLRLLEDEDEVSQGQAAIALLRVDPSYFVYRLNDLLIQQGLEEADVVRTRVYLFLRHVAKQDVSNPAHMAPLNQLWRIAHFNGLLDSNVAYLLNSVPATSRQPLAPTGQPAAVPENTGTPAFPPPAPAPEPQPKNTPGQDTTFDDLFGQ